MALKIIDHGSKEYEQMLKLRNDLLRTPLGLEFSDDELEQEKNEILIAAFEDEKMLGCCMIVKNDHKNCRLRQMAVLNTLQGKGIGRALMTFAENIARDQGFKKLNMHARKTALGFYQRLGYKVVGEEFAEITIPHFEMEKSL